MRLTIKLLLPLATVWLMTVSVHSADVVPFRDQACPDAWVFTDKAIPVIRSTTNPWGEGNTDKLQAKLHIASTDVIETVMANPATADDLVNDPLTVASECLVFKNMLVDGVQYYPPSPEVPRNAALGFIAASVF